MGKAHTASSENAVTCVPQEVRILANTNWRPLATLEHRSILKDEATKIVAYQEVDETSSTQRSPGKHRSRYIVCEMPVRIQTLKAPLDKANPALGVGAPLDTNGRIPHLPAIFQSSALEMPGPMQ